MSTLTNDDQRDSSPLNSLQRFQAANDDDDLSAVLKKCMILLKTLLEQAALNSYEVEVPKDSWKDQYVRMRLWAADIGAHGQDEASLTFRLRQSPDVANLIYDLMADIVSCLEDVQHFLEQDQDNEIQPRTDSDADSDHDSNSLTMLQELYTSLETYITSLFRLSTIIHNSAQYERAIFYDKGLVNETAPFFVDHLRERFPQAEEFVLERLGNAISRRRGEIEYRRKQSEKRKRSLARFLEESSGISEGSQTETKYSDYADRQIDLHEDTRSEFTTMTGYSDLETATAEGRIQIPHPPSELGSDNPFECPYCFKVQRVKDFRGWQRHVFRDSLPYVCLCSDCSAADTLYTSRREYFKHISQNHAAWTIDKGSEPCLLCKERPTPSFLIHLSQHLLELALFSVRPYDADSDNIDAAIGEDDETESDDYPDRINFATAKHAVPRIKYGNLYIDTVLPLIPAQRLALEELLDIIKHELTLEIPMFSLVAEMVMAGKRKNDLQPTIVLRVTSGSAPKKVKYLVRKSPKIQDFISKHGLSVSVIESKINLA